jgi:biopolymer transport protein TolR
MRGLLIVVRMSVNSGPEVPALAELSWLAGCPILSDTRAPRGETLMAFSTGGRGPFQGQMNVTPLIDVLLVLIIVFMVVEAMTKEKGLEAQIPQPAETQPNSLPPPRTIVVQVVWTGKDKAPQLRINQDDVSWAELQPRLRDIFKQRAEKVAFVRGDDDIDFEYVAQVIDDAREAGVERVGLMTKTQAGQ